MHKNIVQLRRKLLLNYKPPPPPVHADVVPMRVETDPIAEPVKKKIVRVPLARCGLASKGKKISLQTNHFKVNVTNVNGHFFHYSSRTDRIVLKLFGKDPSEFPCLAKSDYGLVKAQSYGY